MNELPSFRFEWTRRPHGSQREFYNLLNSIEIEFRYDHCNLGDAGYWRRLKQNLHITAAVEMFVMEGNRKDRAGFALIKEGFQCFPDPNNPGFSHCTYDNPCWYVDLICTKSEGMKGKGGLLLKEIEDQARAHGMKNVSLSAVPYVIMFYYNRGFRLTMDTRGVEDAQLSALASEIRGNMQQYRFKEVDDAFKNPEFVKFLRVAVTKGLAATRQLERGKKPSDSFCEGADCAADGIYMTLSLDSPTFDFQPPPPKIGFMDWASNAPIQRSDFDETMADFQ